MANGINRYYLPAQQQVANTYVPIPFEEILAVSQAQQKAFDDLEAKRQALEDTDFYALDPDLDYVTNKQNEMLKDTESVVDAYSSGDLRKARKMYQDIDRKWKKELNPLTGITGAAMAQYDKRQDFYNKLIEDEDLKPFQIQAAMNAFDEQYEKQGGVGLDPKNLGTYKYEEIEDYLDWSDFMIKHGKDVKANIDAYANVSFQGYDENGNPQYIYTTKGTDERITEQELYRALVGDQFSEGILGGLAGGSGAAKAYLEQGTRLGYSSVQEMLNALYGTGEALSYYKETRDEDIKGDPLYQYKTDKAEEKEAKKRAHMQDWSHLVPEDMPTFSQQVTQRRQDINTLETSIYTLENSIKENYPLDAEGNLLNPELRLNYEHDLNELKGLQTALSTNKIQQALDNDIFFNAYGEISGMDIKDKKILSIAPDKNGFTYEDYNSITGFYDADGNVIPLDIYQSNMETVPKDKDITAFMKANNLTPIPEIKTESYGTNKERKQYMTNLLDSRSAKSKDMIVTGYSDLDLKNSTNLQTVKTTMFNLPEMYTVKTIDSEGKYKDTGKTLKDYYVQYGGLTDWYQVDVVTGKKVVEADSRLVADLEDGKNSQIIQMPNGNHIIVTPKNTKLHTELMNQAYYNIYKDSGDEIFKIKYLKNYFPEVVKRTEDFKLQVAANKAYGKGSTINTAPIELGDGYYLHVGTIDAQGVTSIWVDSKSNPQEYPGENVKQVHEIPLNELTNSALTLLESLTLNN